MDNLTEQQRWAILTVLAGATLCGAAVLLVGWKRAAMKTAARAADLHARDSDMVAEGAPASAVGAIQGAW